MKTTAWRTESGQTLVYVALAMVVILGMVSLAIDASRLYQVRRQMQNAADAGALAGARSYCSQDGTDPETEAINYAQKNPLANSSHPMVVDVMDSTLASNGTITVTATTPVDTFLASLFGAAQVDVSAIAAAKCGVTPQACGIWPIAFPFSDWVDAAGWAQQGWESAAGCQTMYVWQDENKDINCDWFDCSISDPVTGEITQVIKGAGTRGWLDLGCPAPAPYDEVDPCKSSGANCVQCRLQYGSPAPVAVGSCLASQPGVAQVNVEFTNDASIIGDTFWLPLYDEVCEPGQGKPAGYVVKDFGCITNQGSLEMCFWPTLAGCPAAPNPLPTNNGQCRFTGQDECVGNPQIEPVWARVIKVSKDCDECLTSCGQVDPNAPPPQPGSVVGVNLIR